MEISNSFSHSPTPSNSRSRYSRSRSLVAGGLQQDALGRNGVKREAFWLSCGHQYQPEARTVPWGVSLLGVTQLEDSL